MIPQKFQKHIDEYKKIKAPETLHDRVIASSGAAVKRPRIPLPQLLAAAASLAAALVIVTVGVFTLRKGDTELRAYVAYDGQPVETAVAINMNDAADIRFFDIGTSVSGGIKLDVHITDTATVTVSDGTVTLVDENGIATDTGSSLTLPHNRDSYTVHWLADFYKATESEPFSLILEDAHCSVTYTLNISDSTLTLTPNN